MRETLMAACCVAAALFAGSLVLAGPASAQAPAGQLRCALDAAPGLNVATNRVVNCLYRRGKGPAEFYYGYTGFIAVEGAPSGNTPVAVYDVVSIDPGALAALQGDFDGPLLTVGTTLTRGESRPVSPLLVPAVSPVGLPGPNVTNAIGHLHLIYAGVLHRRGGWPAAGK